MFSQPNGYKPAEHEPKKVIHLKNGSVPKSRLNKLSEGVGDFGKHLNRVLKHTGYGILSVQDFSYNATKMTWWITPQNRKEVNGEIHLADFHFHYIQDVLDEGKIVLTCGVDSRIHLNFFLYDEMLQNLKSTIENFDFKRLKKEILIP